MTQIQRILAITVSAALLLSAFALGKISNSSDPVAAEKPAAVAAANSPAPATTAPAAPAANAEAQQFYLTDFKTGYDEGFQQGKTGQSSGVLDSSRVGFNEGFKEGYSAGTESRLQPQAAKTRTVVQPTSFSRSSVVYRERPVYRQSSRGGSKLRTALTIAAPAAVGAGIGAIAGGKKGAGAGALIGGGGGALYHLFKNR